MGACSRPCGSLENRENHMSFAKMLRCNWSDYNDKEKSTTTWNQSEVDTWQMHAHAIRTPASTILSWAFPAVEAMGDGATTVPFWSG